MGIPGGGSSSSTHACCSGNAASGGQRGTVSDLALQAKEMVRIRSQVEEVLARHTHHDIAKLRADMDRDKVFTAEEAVAYGLADQVLVGAS